jgi:hypothetical protein
VSAKKATSPVPSLRDLCVTALDNIAAEIRKAEPTMTREKSIAKAAQTPEGLEVRRFYQMPGAEQPFTEVLAHLAKGEFFLEEASMRDVIVAKRQQVAKEGSGGGSGPRGGRIEDPKISGPKAPADTLPAQSAGRKVTSPISPADAILADLHAQALRAAPSGTSQEAATAAFLQTSAGQTLHRSYNAAMAAKREAQ